MIDYPNGFKRNWNSQVEALIARAERGDVQAANSLVNWFQDMNCPGSPKARDYLVNNAGPGLPKVKKILSGEDGCW